MVERCGDVGFYVFHRGAVFQEVYRLEDEAAAGFAGLDRFAGGLAHLVRGPLLKDVYLVDAAQDYVGAGYRGFGSGEIGVA